MDEAVRYCIENDILKDVLEGERAAVKLEMLTTFDEKLYEEGLREEGREEGREEERANTEKERQRADKERQRADKERQRADAVEAELAKYKEKYGDVE